MKVNLVKAKSILTKSKLPGCDYVINPYTGCGFACIYCYADFMRRFTGHEKEKWGEFVDVKINAAKMLEKELKRWSNKKQKAYRKVKPSILFGSVTDPYQGVEAKYKITRRCLEKIFKADINVEITILTKSHLVTRDIDMFKKYIDIDIGLTITTTDDEVSRLFEKNASPVSLRLEALKKLHKEQIPAYVFVSPLLPHFSANENELRKLFDSIENTGNKEIWLEHINLSGNMLKRIRKVLRKRFPETVKYFEEAKSDIYKMQLNKLLKRILEDYEFEIGSGGIIDHKNKTIFRIDNNSRIDMEGKNWKYKNIS